MLFVLEPIELCAAQAFRWSCSLGSKGQEAQRLEPGVTNAGARPCCCCMLVRGDQPASLPRRCMARPTGTARRPEPALPPLTPAYHPTPHGPFRAGPFSRSFRGPIKRLAHSVHSKMCNVRKRVKGGREKIPKGLIISSCWNTGS